jgi:protein LTV1
MGGTIDFNEENNALEFVLDEFLQAAKDTVFAEGTKHRKGARSTIVVPPRDADGAALDADEAEGEVDIQRELQEQVELQEETEQVLLRMKRDAANKDTSIETCQAYLQEVRIEEEWDCESILSTYSTLDNHPTLIKVTPAHFRACVGYIDSLRCTR